MWMSKGAEADWLTQRENLDTQYCISLSLSLTESLSVHGSRGPMLKGLMVDFRRNKMNDMMSKTVRILISVTKSLSMNNLINCVRSFVNTQQAQPRDLGSIK